MKMRFSACAAEAPSMMANVMVARRDRIWAPTVPGPGSVDPENAGKTVKAALTASECRMSWPLGLGPGRGYCSVLTLPGALLTLPGAWIIVPAMNGLNAICGICRDN